MHILFYLAAGGLLLILASFIALYAYGRFARRVRGEPGQVLPVAPADTTLDRAVAPLLAAHPGHSGLALIERNLDAFALRALSARLAERSLDLQYYIWNDDRTGRLLDRELLHAADRGVRVRLLLDDINVRGRDRVVLELDSHPNIEVRLFNPARNRAGILGRGVELLLRATSLNRRMHNKAWIADGRLAIVGGRNVGDEYFDANEALSFRDLDLLLLGPAATETGEVFDRFWNSDAVIPIRALHRARRFDAEHARRRLEALSADGRSSPYEQSLVETDTLRSLIAGKLELVWTDRVRVISDPPDKARPQSHAQAREKWMTRDLLTVMSAARQELLVISPYFVPGEGGMEQFAAWAADGVEIAVLTNSLAATDVAVVHAGYSRYRGPLLRAGLSVYEMMPHGGPRRLGLVGSGRASLHTKAAVADGREGFVGSYNLDPRSAQLNTEMGVLFSDERLAGRIRQHFQALSQADESYRLLLEGGALRWQDGRQTPPRIWRREPEAGLWHRAVIRVLRWLPIESQL